ncbi:fluoride efflux transporter CrcB [Zhihengliuella halotolerans]|uniref:fluoride efflux transporter CrcB n=1 Tax=Zhihengliuella halotolerans TaxID=370736 RepID=UPI000C80A04A|nr:fluoride efflux transporter CrcB [Zhihengliuella halotolerans]
MTALLLALAVGGAGAAGAVVRVWLDLALNRLQPTSVPLGTLCANVAGSLVLGAVMAATLTSGLRHDVQIVLAVGLCGGLSTYSSFGVATMREWLAGRYGWAGLNVAVNLVLGYAAAALGWLTFTLLSG